MLFALIFNDKPDQTELRNTMLRAHIDWLEEQKEIIPIGGSLRREPGQTPVGGLWIAEAESKEELEKCLKTDPFYTSGLRQSYEIFYWSKANDERKVVI
jgi:uncharacterized protein YciI